MSREKDQRKNVSDDDSGGSDSDDGMWYGSAEDESVIDGTSFISAIEAFGVSKQDATLIFESMKRNGIIGGDDAVCKSHESLYDVAASAAAFVSSGGDIEEYLARVKKIDTAFAGEYYGDLGGTFATKEFEELRIREVNDFDRKIRGPQLKKGIVRCKDKSCKSFYSKNTTTQAVQLRSGDEAMNFRHTCNTCGLNWTT